MGAEKSFEAFFSLILTAYSFPVGVTTLSGQWMRIGSCLSAVNGVATFLKQEKFLTGYSAGQPADEDPDGQEDDLESTVDVMASSTEAKIEDGVQSGAAVPEAQLEAPTSNSELEAPASNSDALRVVALSVR